MPREMHVLRYFELDSEMLQIRPQRSIPHEEKLAIPLFAYPGKRTQ
jgi:hypothetical protein